MPRTMQTMWSSRVVAGVVLGLAVLVAAGCGGDDDEPLADVGADAPSTSTPVEVAATEQAGSPTATPDADPTPVVLEPDADVLPRSLSYGMLLWTLEDAVITNQDPRTYVAGETGGIAPQTYLILDFEQRNENVRIGLLSGAARLQLTLADGTVVDNTFESQDSVGPAATGESRYAFEVPESTTFQGLTVVIGDTGREPSVVLPLSGDAPDVEAADAREVELSTAIPLPGIEMTWTVNTLTLWHDWPLPVGHPGGAILPTMRSEAGDIWLGIEAQVQVGACECRGGVLDQAASVRLLIDGQPVTPEARDSSSEIMNAQTVSDVMMVFTIPADTETATLQIGPLDTPEEQTTIELDLGTALEATPTPTATP